MDDRIQTMKEHMGDEDRWIRRSMKQSYETELEDKPVDR